MFKRFKTWLKTIEFPESLTETRMEKVGQVGNATIFVRRVNKERQEFQDYISENNIYRDGTVVEQMCLMPNHHSVYFEVMLNNKYSQRIGYPGQHLDLSKGFDQAVNEYVNNVFIPRVESKLQKYNDLFNK